MQEEAKAILSYGWTIVCALVGVVWSMLTGRIKAIEARLESKADADDVQKALGHIEKLYANAERDRALTRDLHDKALEKIDSKTQQILDAIRAR